MPTVNVGEVQRIRAGLARYTGQRTGAERLHAIHTDARKTPDSADGIESGRQTQNRRLEGDALRLEFEHPSAPAERHIEQRMRCDRIVIADCRIPARVSLSRSHPAGIVITEVRADSLDELPLLRPSCEQALSLR